MKAPSEEIYDKSTQGTLKCTLYIRWVTTLLLAIWAYIHSFSCCWLQNQPNPARFFHKFEL